MPSLASLLVTRALLPSVGLLVLLFRYLMGPLATQAIEMQHMDPTDIVLVPYDVHRLAIFVACTFVANLGMAIMATGYLRFRTVPSLFLEWLRTTALFWMAAVVCGTPPTRDVYHTGLACSFLATLVIICSLPPAGGTGMDKGQKPSTGKHTWWHARLVLPVLPDAKKKRNSMERLSFDAKLLSVCQVHATVFVTIPFQVLRLYDWGSQIQRWPLPMILGSTYGFVLGSILGFAGISLMHCSPTVAGWYQLWTATSKDASVSQHQD